MLATLARVYLELGEMDRAEETAQRGLTIARERKNGLWVPELLRVQGMILARQGRWEEAEEAFREAVSLAHTMPYPYAEGRALYERGMMHVHREDPQAACQSLQDAVAIFRRLGAQKDLEPAEQALAALDRSADPAR